ncbi:hypothetical protein CK203_045130 [Vitis vinifera]|uniref:Uncharacterized protein n=1 Tax=Vitis vinifera TaxID=29760 RepID=A0A438HCY1_VITVI|nr:hypothetical protein CK203_045130 [Vitis vinifera]
MLSRQHRKGPKNATIDYISSENLKVMPDPETQITGLTKGLDSKDWAKVCESLNDAKQFALYHSALMAPILEKVLLVLVKAMKNPRSALSKTSIMASTDILNTFGDELLQPHPNNTYPGRAGPRMGFNFNSITGMGMSRPGFGTGLGNN